MSTVEQKDFDDGQRQHCCLDARTKVWRNEQRVQKSYHCPWGPPQAEPYGHKYQHLDPFHDLYGFYPLFRPFVYIVPLVERTLLQMSKIVLELDFLNLILGCMSACPLKKILPSFCPGCIMQSIILSISLDSFPWCDNNAWVDVVMVNAWRWESSIF